MIRAQFYRGAVQRADVAAMLQLGDQLVPEERLSLAVIRPLQVWRAQDGLERARHLRRGELAQDDGNDDVTTLARDAAAREVHLE